MTPFLAQVADLLYSKYGDEVSKFCFVFPNRRSSLFFQRYLGIRAGKPIYSPALTTNNDLFASLSGFRAVDKIEALYILYKHYIEHSESSESFDEFVLWGDMILNDFDDVDKYMADAQMLFANIEDLRDLDSGYDFLSEEQLEAIKQFWGICLESEGKSDNNDSIDKKKIFKETWRILYPLYVDFRKELSEKGLAYEGMIYRYVADVLKGDQTQERERMIGELRKYSQIIFIGQNALNKCEKSLLDTLCKEVITDFYWDYYGEMITDHANKSSLFMKENIVRYPSRFKLEAPEYHGPQHFSFVSVPSSVGQTKVVSSMLSKLISEGGFVEEKSAIVLPDEGLLFPMLNSIPANISQVNVTMGYPLSASSVYTFVNLFDSLFKNRRDYKGERCFYHKDVISIIEHPFVEAIAHSESIDLKREILSKNQIFPAINYLASKCELFSILFRDINNSEDLAEYLVTMLQYIQKGISPLERECAYHYYRSVIRLRDLNIPMEVSTCFKLLWKIVSVITIPFRGEPLAGLQIMGPLETRSLDFENVYILSSNDGVFPKKSVSASFIPYNLRRGFDLPNYEFQDSISAYHFYRSIYRAKNVVMLYDSRTEGMNSGEVSRYIKQLKYLYSVAYDDIISTYSMEKRENFEDEKRVVQKDDKVMAQLRDLFITGKGVFSASSLKNYLNCPLQFYYTNVLKIKEEEEVVEELDATLFGSIYHKVMEEIYKTYVGRVVSQKELYVERMNHKNIERLIDDSFASEGNIQEIGGKDLINKQLIMRCVDRTLEVDNNYAPFTMIGTEQKVDLTLPTKAGKVRLFGIIDRVDAKEVNSCRVVDYKTGKTDDKVVTKVNSEAVDALFDKENTKREIITFQLLFYLLLTQKEPYTKDKKLNSCVYGLSDLFGAGTKEYPVEREIIDEFKDRVVALIEEIFDPSVPFTAMPDKENRCKYCGFKQLCKVE